jgi:hypothetical protein
LKRKKAVLAFYYEDVEQLKDHFETIVKTEEENVDYHTVLHLEDVLEIMENNQYSDVYVSGVEVFEGLSEFGYFSEVVLGNGANYHIDEEGICSSEMYTVGEILAKVGNCFN